MKLYLMTDLEGVAGVYQWEDQAATSLENHEQRHRQRRWLAQEVSAAVDGLFASGATKVIVNDGHGAGYTIDLDYMDPRAEIINGQQRPFWLPYLDESCTATGIVGAHAKAGTPDGCLYHTMGRGVRDWQFNGISLGETGLQAAIAGHYGVPFVLCTGDAWACREMEKLIPGVVTAPVKYGTGRFSALTCPPQEAQRRIHEAAERAMGVIDQIEPFKLSSPVHFRDERIEPLFDEEKPAKDFKVINPHVREAEADNIIQILALIYGYDLDWKPLEFTPAWKK